MTETLIQELIEAGTPGALVARVAMALAQAQAKAEILETRRRNERERKAKSREVTGQDVTERDSRDTPSLDKESFPQTPFKEIKPNPEHIARARRTAGFEPPEGVDPISWQTFASQRKKRLTQIAYDRILKTLADGKRAGWPPGELIERAIERGWETVFVPKDERNGRHVNGQSTSGFGRTIDAALDFVRDVEASQRC